MGLNARLTHRLHVWLWRVRYWWLDTRGGQRAQLAALCLSCLVVVVQLLRMLVEAAVPPPPGTPAKANYWWVVQLIIVVVAAVISYAMRPKVEGPKPQEGKAPTTQDGLSAKHYFGICWIDDEFLLAWKNMGTIPIKTKGGKK